MAFDWTKLEGYREDMTADEKIALMENYQEPEAPKPDGKMIEKAQFDKLASELADTKKQLRARMTTDEQAEEARKNAESALKAELEQLRKEKTLATYKAGFLAQGYDDTLATETAKALAENDTEGMFLLMAKQTGLREKALRAQILKETPIPPAGEGDSEQIKALEEYNRIRCAAGLPKVNKLP